MRRVDRCLCISNDVLGAMVPKGLTYFDMYDIRYCLRIEFLDIYAFCLPVLYYLFPTFCLVRPQVLCIIRCAIYIFHKPTNEKACLVSAVGHIATHIRKQKYCFSKKSLRIFCKKGSQNLQTLKYNNKYFSCYFSIVILD